VSLVLIETTKGTKIGLLLDRLKLTKNKSCVFNISGEKIYYFNQEVSLEDVDVCKISHIEKTNEDFRIS